MCVIFFNLFVLQFSLPSLLSKCSIYVLETWSSLLGSGEADTRSQSSQKGLCMMVAKFGYSMQQTFYEHKCIFLNSHVLGSIVTSCTIVCFVCIFYVSRHFPSWKWLMEKIIIMLLKSNEKLKSKSERGTGRDYSKADPHHHCMHRILYLCIFTCTLAYNTLLITPIVHKHLFMDYDFLRASFSFGQGLILFIVGPVSTFLMSFTSTYYQGC